MNNPEAPKEDIEAQFKKMRTAINRGNTIRIARYAVPAESNR